MQKYSGNITTSSGSALRNVAVTVKDEQGNLATLYEDRYGNVPASNPRITASDGTYSFYAANGRYTLEAMVEGVNYIDGDVVLLYDPKDAPAGQYAYPAATQQEAEDENEVALLSFSPLRIWQAIGKWWTGVTVPISQGGTGATDAQSARQALGVDYGTSSGTVVEGNDQRVVDGAAAFAQIDDKIEDINGLIQAGANVVLSGSGTDNDPYVIDSTGGGGGGSSVWGAIGGTLANQTDLKAALDSKANASSLADVATSGAYSDLHGLPPLGTAAAEDVPSSGDASSGQVVMGNDSRLGDARAPTAHTHTLSDITDAGTAAAKDVPSGGDAASGEVVLGDDSRLADARTPTSHSHTLSEITDAGTAAAVDTGTGAGDVPTTAQADLRYAQLAKAAHFLDTLDVDGAVALADTLTVAKKATLEGDLDVDGAVALLQMPKVGGSPIVESGSNANGSFVKYADGAAFCSQRWLAIPSPGVDVTLTTTWTIPVAFIGGDGVFVAIPDTPSPETYDPIAAGGTGEPSFAIYTRRSISGDHYFRAIAMGRWK